MISYNTADLCDKEENLQIADSIFKSFGKNKKFFGKIRTVVAVEDNSYVKKLVDMKVNGDVMVIDGKGSTKCALLGDNLAMLAYKNGWAGFVINGCIRDTEIINNIEIGIKALNSAPNKSKKENVGEYETNLNFANIIFEEGHYLYSDADGIVVSKNELVKPEKI